MQYFVAATASHSLRQLPTMVDYHSRTMEALCVENRVLKQTVKNLVAMNNQTREKSNKFIEECSDIVEEVEAEKEVSTCLENIVTQVAVSHVLQGKIDGLTKENHELKRNQKRLTSATVNELPAAAAAQKDDVTHEQVSKKQCQGGSRDACLNPTGCDKCLKEPKDKSRRQKWKDMRFHFNSMQTLTKEQIKGVVKKNSQPPQELDVLYKKEAKCIKASDLMKLAPEGASERYAKERKTGTAGILCPNCFHKYLMSNV